MRRRGSSTGSIGSGPVTLDRLRELLAAPKGLATVPAWRARDEKLEMSCPLVIEEAIVEGLELRGTALLRRSLCEVMFGLVYAPAGRRGGMFERIDAWPLRPHRNPGHAPKKLRFLTIDKGVSHRHSLERNAELGLDRLLDRLEIAEPLDPQPQSWAELVDELRALWGLTCDVAIPPPPWEPDLFFQSPPATRRGGRKA